MQTTTDIKKRTRIKDLLKTREILRDKVGLVFKTVKEFDEQCRVGLDRYGMYGIQPEERNKEKLLKRIDEKCWTCFLLESGIENTMTKNAIAKLREQLEKEPPEFCEREIKIILANAEQFYGQKIEQTFKEVYNSLIGCSYYSGYLRKRDNLREVKQSFRISSQSIQKNWDEKGFHYESYLSYRRFDYEDFYTVFKLLDEKPRSDYSNTFMIQAERDLKERKSDVVTTPYFDVRCYKNGNQLVKIKRLDLLRLFNKYGTNGSRLPDHMSKRYKQEHFK